MAAGFPGYSMSSPRSVTLLACGPYAPLYFQSQEVFMAHLEPEQQALPNVSCQWGQLQGGPVVQLSCETDEYPRRPGRSAQSSGEWRKRRQRRSIYWGSTMCAMHGGRCSYSCFLNEMMFSEVAWHAHFLVKTTRLWTSDWLIPMFFIRALLRAVPAVTWCRDTRQRKWIGDEIQPGPSWPQYPPGYSGGRDTFRQQ